MSDRVSGYNPVTWETHLKGNCPLYRAQDAAMKAVSTKWFPCYNKDHINSQQGFKGSCISVYSHVYDVAAVIHFVGEKALGLTVVVVQKVAFTVLKIGDVTLGWMVHPLEAPFIRVYNAVYPINQINGHRHFIAMPRSWEKWIGENVIYPLSTYQLATTTEKLDGSNKNVMECAQETVNQIYKANRNLLNPPGKTEFTYSAEVMASNQFNAFATPGGNMVVYSHLMQELNRSIQRGDIEGVTVQQADGSEVSIDLRDVTFNDVMLALLGHEMTHVASRHGIASIVQSFLRSILFAVGRLALIEFIRSKDPSVNSRQLNNLLISLENKIKGMSFLSQSRCNEYEADVTGVYFVNNVKESNPLGALYLQEFLLTRSHSDAGRFLHRHFEFLLTHPCGENRKRALLAAMTQICPEKLQGMEVVRKKTNPYNVARSSEAIKFASYIEKKAE